MECYYMEDRVALWLAGHRHGSHGEIKRQGAALIRVTSLRPAGGSLARWGYPQLAGWFLWTGKYHRSKWMMTRGTPMTMESLIFLDTLYQEWWKIDMRDHSYMIVRIKRNWILTYVDRFFETEQTKTLRRSTTHGTCVFFWQTWVVHRICPHHVGHRDTTPMVILLHKLLGRASQLLCDCIWVHAQPLMKFKSLCRSKKPLQVFSKDFPEVPNSMGQKKCLIILVYPR